MTVRTRFAPSPTGYLHLGSARTALYSWLYAKNKGGKFILRVEDTDRERSTEDAIKAIFDGMTWLGLDWDEGPFYQTKRYDRYGEVIQQLLGEGKAYRCYCSKERTDALRKSQMQQKIKPRYDGHCRDLPAQDNNAPHVIRFKNPQSGEVIVEDQVYGPVVFQNSELDDLIIARSDGTPTYNFCVVVDDWDMNITHVIRGDDHLNNTPRQINILTALGAQLPIYAHVPMILGPDGKKLSKRAGAVGVMNYRDEGILPEALMNYLVRLGWSHGDQEIFTQEEMIDHFDIVDLNKSASALNPEKLLWLNQHTIKNLPAKEVAKQLVWHMHHQGIDTSFGPPLEQVITALQERAKTLVEIAEQSKYFYEDVTTYSEKAAAKHLTQEALPILEDVKQRLASLSPWDKEGIHQAIQAVVETHQVKMGKVAQPIRVAVTGDTISPSIDVTLQLLGQEKTMQRLEKAIEHVT